MKISEKIYRLRTEHDLTQVQFGKLAGVSDKAVSTWEIGTKEPRMKPLQKICAYFCIDINLFVDTGTEVYKKEEPTTASGDGLNDKTKELLTLLDTLSPEKQTMLIELARLYVEDQQRNK